MYKIVKRYYDQGFYSKGDVAVFVKGNRITPDDYQKITGEEYKAE